MALDWVQVETGLPRSLAVASLATLLGMSPREAVGLLVELQAWAAHELPRGRFTPSASAGRPEDAPRTSAPDESVWVRALERAVYWTGEPGAAWDALLRAGVLVREEDSVRLTLADRYVQALEKRAKEAERKRLARARAKGGASGGRPQDVPPQKRREEMRGEGTSAAAGGRGASGGRPVPVPPPLPSDTYPDVPPTQRALPGTHLVPATAPRGERLQASQEAPGASEAAPEALPGPDAPTGALGLWEHFQAERRKALPGMPNESMPTGWAAWYTGALEEVGEDERLREAVRGFMSSGWARSRQPPCPPSAFISPKVWPRHVPPRPEEPEAAGELAPVDTSTEHGRLWQAVLDELAIAKKAYALTWLQKASPVGLEDGELVVQCPDGYFRDWVSELYGAMVDDVACGLGLEGVRFVVAEGQQAASA